MKLNKTYMNWKRPCVAAILVGLLVGCAQEEDSIQIAPLPEIESQLDPQQVWQAKIGDGVGKYYSRLTPVYAYDKIFVADRDGEVAALNPKNGEKLWEMNLGDDKPIYISGGLTASYEKLYFGTETGELIALNTETGEVVWRINVGGEILAKPLADESLIVVNTSRGDLVAFDAQLGEQLWKITTDVPSLTLRGDSAPASTSGGVFWGMANGRLGAALLQSGNVIWQQPIATPKGASEIDRLVDVDSKPAIYGTTLYTLGYNGQLTAIDLRSGRPVWRRSYSGTNDLIVSGDSLYFSNAEDVIYAVDARSGTELWNNAELKNRQLTNPVLIDGYLVFGDAEGYLHWLEPSSGDFVSQMEFKGDGFATAPVDIDGDFLVITRNGRLSLHSLYDDELSVNSESEFEEDYLPQVELD